MNPVNKDGEMSREIGDDYPADVYIYSRNGVLEACEQDMVVGNVKYTRTLPERAEPVSVVDDERAAALVSFDEPHPVYQVAPSDLMPDDEAETIRSALSQQQPPKDAVKEMLVEALREVKDYLYSLPESTDEDGSLLVDSTLFGLRMDVSNALKAAQQEQRGGK